MFRKRSLARVVLIAATCLAIAAPAAQARPIGLVPGSQPGTWKASPTTTAQRSSQRVERSLRSTARSDVDAPTPA
jgi:ABC-type sugar transport system substrate-binding protein